MVCEICQQREASVHLKQICNGQMKEMRICEQCARENGFDVQSPLAMTDFLFGLGSTPAEPSADTERVCSVCHMRSCDLRKTSRLGCAHCYEAFRSELEPMIENMHYGPRHTGKVPAGEAAGLEAAALREALEAAVHEQRFEDAAVLRDRLRACDRTTALAAEAGEPNHADDD